MGITGRKKDRIAENREYWIPKIERNMQRNIINNEKLKKMGWTVIRFWEREVKEDLKGCILKIRNM